MSGTPDRADEVLASEVVYPGRLINLRVDTVRTGKGHVVKREVVEHPGAVGIVAIDGGGRVVLVRQYRHAVGRATLEIPAGTLGQGEDPAECARRELHEETGLAAASWRALPRLFPTPGFCNEAVSLFLATGLKSADGTAEQDLDEDIALAWLPLDEAVVRVARGEIVDGKTMVGLLLAARERGDG